MEEEGGAKAPVTRLRRRLSVEQSDDVKSSSAPNTPTKKRGGRRVAKPELDLIDENALENNTSKKGTKKANMKELEVEEKPVTPSRRSARIKSNTSLVLATDSPRAKRASRRNSQVGSDTEAPLTPARLTRRTRRDSANTDKAEPQPTNKTVVSVAEVIVEEPETSIQKSSNSEKSIEQIQLSSSLRKSPRLSLTKNRNDSIDENEKVKNKSEKLTNNNSRDSIEFNEKQTDKSKELNNSNKENELSQEKQTPVIKLIDISNDLNDFKNNQLSISNVELLNNLENEPKKKYINLNKSSSALTDIHSENFKYNRHRTKSWTTLSDSIQDDNKWYSDSESAKKTKKNRLNTLKSGDVQNVTKNVKDKSNLSSNEKIRTVHDISTIVETKLVNSPDNKDKLLSPATNNTSTNLFDKEPTNNLQTLVIIEESDSNSEKCNTHKQLEDADVPKQTSPKKDKTQSIFNFNPDNENNVTINKNEYCEPMDIDETLPDNTISNKLLLKTLDMSNKNLSVVNDDDENKIKSSVTLNTSQTLDKTTIKNKSTLVLSQLKDISNENSVPQSLVIPTNKKSNSDEVLNITQDNLVDKKNVSPNYLTSTPLQQRSIIKHAIHVNTSDINSNNTSKIDRSNTNIDVSNTNKSEESGSDAESSQEGSNFVDDEAEEASDDYESGNSRDEEEKQYEREHEIVQKGDTLTSEDELSNDTDYEKDSFVVSSDQEDYELLDGSGDDLSSTDNELKMTTASKKKYNERKTKEQKMASREMFESRYKVNASNKSNKTNLNKPKKNRAILDSSDSDDENIQVKIKKNKRMRLDSSHETSINKSVEKTSKNQLNNSLPKSVHNENDINETELTVIEDDIKEIIGSSSTDLKKESNTPQKETVNTSVQFIDPEQSEKRKVNSNMSYLYKTFSDDPSEDANTSESSDSSNNVHIQKYDSVLNDLNESIKTKKNNKGDISLNIDRKPKQKSVPIVDQLNLTQTKLKKKKQDVNSENSKKSLNIKSKEESDNSAEKKSVSKTKSTHEDSDSESSASIDLHLLFSEDSNNSEDVKMKDKKGEQNDKDDSFIPLKKSHGKTDIFETSGSNNKLHTESTKEINKKNRTLDKSSSGIENGVGETEIKSFLDTTGTHNSMAADKNKKHHVTIDHEDSESDSPTEVLNKTVREAQEKQVDVDKVISTSVAATNLSLTKSPKSVTKKKRKASLTVEQTDSTENNLVIDDDIETKVNQSGAADKSVNKSVSKTPKSERKKAKRMSESHTAEQDDNLNPDAQVEVANKNLIKTREHQVDVGEDINKSVSTPNKSTAKTPKSDKKKKRTSENQMQEQTDATVNEPDIEDDIETRVNESGITNKSIDKSMSKTPKSEKKKTKRTSESQTAEQPDEQISFRESDAKNISAKGELDVQHEIEKQDDETEKDNSIDKSSIKTQKSEKNKKKVPETEAEIPFSHTDKVDASSAEKKKAKRISQSNDANNTENDAENNNVDGSKKRKRKSSLNQAEEDAESEEFVPSHTSKINTSTAAIGPTKKRKISHNVEDSANFDQAPMANTEVTNIEKQLNQHIVNQKHPLQYHVKNTKNTPDVNVHNQKVSKKRKDREDDEGNKISKVLKVNTGDKLQVKRLPANILNLLEDKPAHKTQQVAKSKAISTTNFIVEDTKVKKIKPSNYLEESIYLNAEEEGESKKQKYIKNPKVLPFLPTVSTSNSGYTTNFKVNILPKEIKFVAKSTSVNNYKNDYLQNKKMKRLGTYELYKRNRTIKMSKF